MNQLNELKQFEAFLQSKSVRRTHRKLCTLLYVVSFQDDDNDQVMSYKQLKLYLSRKEIMNLYKNLRCGVDYISGLDNCSIRQVVVL